MKKNFLLAALALSMSSCTLIGYQVIETKSVQNQGTENNDYENKDLRITYNFWNENRQIEFDVFNKTDKPLYLDLNQSHLILNGQSLDYYQDGETISSVRLSSSAAFYGKVNSTQSEKTVSSRMKQVVQIPPKSFVRVTGFSLISGRIIDCDIAKVKSDPVSKTYTAENTPLRFRNYITYAASSDFVAPMVVDNSFYASSISMMNQLDFLGKSKWLKDCPTSSGHQEYSMPYSKPQNIYLKFGGSK